MTRQYRSERPALLRIALIRDETDRLIRDDRYRNTSMADCRRLAKHEVDRGFSEARREGSERP